MSDINTINYQPLEVDEHPYKKVLKHHWEISVIILIVAILLCIFQILIGILVMFLLAVYMGSQVKALKNSSWEGFALANGWAINNEAALDTLLPLSLAFGHNQFFSPVISAVLGNANTDMFAYDTTVGEGKYQRTLHYSVARVMLPAALPHILLRAKAGMAQGVGKDFSDHETLQLEGDFNNYFTLQIDTGQEVNVLEILTPDVMQSLIDNDQREDIEIMAGSLYFITSGDKRTPESVEKLVQSVVTLSDQIFAPVAQMNLPTTPPAQANPPQSEPAGLSA